MEYLIIYDTEGTIIAQIGKDSPEPVGVPFMRVNVPEGQCVAKINIIEEEHIPVFANLPKTELAKAQEQIDQLTIILGDALLEGGM